MLGVTLLIAWLFMRDESGFTPREAARVVAEVRSVIRGSIDGGFRNPPVRWLMLAAPFTAGVGIFAFYALQPYLLSLNGVGERRTVSRASAAAMVAGASRSWAAHRPAGPCDRSPAADGRAIIGGFANVACS